MRARYPSSASGITFKSLLTVLAVSLLALGHAAANSAPDKTAATALAPAYGIIPRPVSLTPKEGQFTLTRDTALVINDEKIRPAATLFRDLITPATGFSLKITSKAPAGPAIRLILTEGGDNPEAYQLSVSPTQVSITASGTAGLFYGLQSLRQLLPVDIDSPAVINHTPWTVPAVEIDDAPLYEYRGLHLDVSRSFFDVAFIKRYIDFIALHKMNRFHWHLTDNQGWRMEIKTYPKLTEIGATRPETVIGHTINRDPHYDGAPVTGYYTQDQIREVVAYAAAREVTIVPEIDIPGHASALLAAYPEIGCVAKDFKVKTRFGVFLDNVCPTEEAFAFLDNIFAEMVELFPGPVLHIGGDEILFDQWQDCAPCTEIIKRENLEDYHGLQSYFIKRVEKLVQKHGKQMAGWNEILDGGINPSAIIYSWTGTQAGIEAAQAGHDVIMAPSRHIYFDQYESLNLDEPQSIHSITPLHEVYHYDPMPAELTPGQQKHILGAQGHIWTEYLRSPRRVEYALFPRLSALSEITWTPKDQQSWPDYLIRLDRYFQRLDLMEINASRATYKVYGEPLVTGRTLSLTLKVEGHDHAIRYTVDGSKPTARSPLYTGPLTFNQKVTVRAVGQNITTGALYGDYRQSFEPHKAMGRKITFNAAPIVGENAHPQATLIDGLRATDRIFQLAEWSQWYDTDLEAVIDLEKMTEVSEVRLGVEAGQYRRLHPPKSISVMTSADNKTWRSVAQLNEAKIRASGPTVSLPFPAQKARYIKIIATKNDKVLSAQYEKMVPVSIFIDEIIVQ